MSRNHYKFFQNKECEYFPCHKGIKKENLNCLFCYCPLFAHCYERKELGMKCEDCLIPHRKNNYDSIIKTLGEFYANKI